MTLNNFKLLGLMILGLSLGCLSQERPNMRGEIILPLKSMQISLDPQLMADMYSMYVVLQLHRGLFRFLPDGTLVPDLVENWTESPDHKIYQFKLRNLTFSDGSPLTADNVVWTFLRLFQNKSAMGIDMRYVVGGAQQFMKSGKPSDLKIRAIEKNVVEFELENPSALFLRQLAVVDCAILPLTKNNRNWTEDLPTSGPYKLIRKTPDEVVIEKWRDDAHASSAPPFKIKFVLSDSGVYQKAVQGTVDSLANEVVTAQEIKTLEAKGWKKILGGLAKERFIILNPKIIPESTRRWMFQQVKQDVLVRELNLPLSPAYGVIPFSLPGALNEKDILDLRDQKINPDATKQIHIDLEFSETEAIDKAVVTYLQKLWENPRVKIQLKGYPTATYIDRVLQAKSAAVMAKKDMDYPDGYSVLGYFDSNYESSFFHISDHQIDSMLRKATQEFDEKRRTEIYRDIQKMILGHFTLIPIGFGANTSGLWSSKMTFVPPHPMGFHTIPLEMIEMAGEAR